jgi:Terminase small subunit
VADQEGCRMLRIEKVREACNKLRDSTAPQPDDMRRRIINELVAIAYSDASGLAKWIIESCASCWDKDPGVLASIEAGGVYPQKINPKCQYCRGRGVGHVSITPTDQLQPNELRLYDGMEVTSAGVKVRLRDRTKALEMLARHFGIAAVDRLEVTGKDGGPIEITGARERLLANLNRRADR